MNRIPEGSPDSSSLSDVARSRPWLADLGVLAVYALLAIALTWPLAPRLATHLPLGDNDLWQNYWNMWWWKTALLERHQSPYYTEMIYFPAGAPLGCHTHSEANILWTLPIQLLFGIPAALNAAILGGFIFAGFGAYLLAKLYFPKRGAAFLAGIVFAFYPQHVEQSLEHLNLASIQAMPFCLWALVQMIRRGSRHRWMLSGGFFALNALFSWHNGLLIIPAAVAVTAVEIWRAPGRRSQAIFDLGKSALFAALLAAPFLWPLLRDVSAGDASLKKDIVPKSIDPISLIIPHGGHPLWGSAGGDFTARTQQFSSVGSLGYLGIAALTMALFSPLVQLRRISSGEAPFSRRGFWLWAALFLLALLLSFGETLQIAGEEITSLPLPFHWLQGVPVFGLVRVANRFLVPAALALGLLAALGGGAIGALLPRQAQRPFWSAAAIVLILDYLWLPYPMQEVPRPAWLPELTRILAQAPEGTAVCDLPSGHRARAAEDMFLQTFHRRPITGGYVATNLRVIDETLKRYPVLKRIFQRYPPADADQGPSLTEALRALKAGAVVVHLDRTVEGLFARRKKAQEEFPGDFYRQRLENPDKGIETAALEVFRHELRQSFGEPAFAAPGEVEIFLVK